MIRKLNAYGFTIEITGWIRSFHTNRKQHVSVNGNESDWSDVASGIPQGSVLGPILFIIYINDIVEQLKSGIYLFADDAKVFRIMKNACTNPQILQQDIDKLCEWSAKWLLEFNQEKCKLMHIGKKDRNQEAYFITKKECQIPNISIRQRKRSRHNSGQTAGI